MSNIDKNLIYDPHATILATADYIEGIGGTFDSSTSIGVALEAIGYTSATTLQEMVLNDKNIHPALATSTKHLLKHITDDEERDLFATASEAYITMYLNINDIIHNAVKTVIDGANTTNYTFTIAKNSTITVANTPFTIMDDINVTLLIDKDNNKSLSVVYDADDDSYVYGGVGILHSNIIVNEDIEWGVFQLPVKQLNVSVQEVTTVTDAIVDITVAIDDQYVYSEIYMTYDGVTTELSKIFSKEAIDINKPSIHISVLDNEVIYSIPKPYIFNNSIRGTIRVFTYTTRGKIELPLGEFETKDFKFRLYSVDKDIEYTVTNNIAILALSNYIVDGGVNRRPFKDVRNKIINKTAGNIVSPVTEQQLIERVKNKGFTIFKLSDTITDRTFVAVRNTSRSVVSPIPTNIDVFLPTVSLTGDIVQSDDKNIYVKEGTLFKVADGKCVPYILPVATKFDTIELLNKNEIFISPFYYTIGRSKGVITSKVYDLREPVIERITVLRRNTFLLATCNIISYRLVKLEDGYDVYLELGGNDKFNSIEDDVVIEIGFHTEDGSIVYYETSVYNVQPTDSLLAEFAGKKLHKVTVNTDFLIDDGIRLYNDLDTTNSLTRIPLDCIATVSIIATTPVVTQHLDSADNANDFEVDKLFNSASGRVTITTEKLVISFGKEITGLWASAYGLYNNSRYKRYAVDEYEVYPEDVYEQFDGCNYKIEDTDGDGICDVISQVKLHTKGERVLVDGKNVIKHSKGEIKYLDGKPVEGDTGIDIFADILLLDYRYNYLNISVYNDYIKQIIDQVVKWCLIDLKEVNDNMLERSVLLFKPNKNLAPVITKYGEYDGLIKPTIELYYDDSIDLDTDFSTLNNTIGKIVAIYFGKSYIDINDLEKAIKDILPENPASVKVTYNASSNNIINVISDNRFRIGKKINVVGELVYDLDLIVRRI